MRFWVRKGGNLSPHSMWRQSAMKMTSENSEKQSEHSMCLKSMIPRVWNANFEKVVIWNTLLISHYNHTFSSAPPFFHTQCPGERGMWAEQFERSIRKGILSLPKLSVISFIDIGLCLFTPFVHIGTNCHFLMAYII